MRRGSLSSQGSALGDAELVLFVDDGQTQVRESNIAFKQGMGADDPIEFAGLEGA